ncbi:hypothetical protein DB41_HW00150 [Neochlamydia sp. TUME1]|nr:hypothetical protein DB41_HW00150 [Neochlamydia sp. TUME1]
MQKDKGKASSYTILEVQINASEKEIKNAHKKIICIIIQIRIQRDPMKVSRITQLEKKRERKNLKKSRGHLQL